MFKVSRQSSSCPSAVHRQKVCTFAFAARPWPQTQGVGEKTALPRYTSSLRFTLSLCHFRTYRQLQKNTVQGPHHACTLEPVPRPPAVGPKELEHGRQRRTAGVLVLPARNTRLIRVSTPVLARVLTRECMNERVRTRVPMRARAKEDEEQREYARVAGGNAGTSVYIAVEGYWRPQGPLAAHPPLA